jgi:AcrR family transcriptional regulator
MTEFVSGVECGTHPTDESRSIGLNSKEKLLRSAEVLFASKGYRDVSVREIAAHAGVNSGLVGYYFRGKQALFTEIFRAHTIPLARELMRQLESITQSGGTPSVEELLKAWLVPWLQSGNNPHARAIHLGIFANLSREGSESTKRALAPMHHVHKAFIKALHSCLPYLSQETLMWRLHFVMGALVFGIIQPVALLSLSGGRCDPKDMKASFDQMLPYAIGGFCARESNPQ